MSDLRIFKGLTSPTPIVPLAQEANTPDSHHLSTKSEDRKTLESACTIHSPGNPLECMDHAAQIFPQLGRVADKHFHPTYVHPFLPIPTGA
jgi:hypothetical protein